MFIGFGDTEVPSGIDRISWRVVFELKESVVVVAAYKSHNIITLRRRVRSWVTLNKLVGLSYQFPKLWGHRLNSLDQSTTLPSDIFFEK